MLGLLDGKKNKRHPSKKTKAVQRTQMQRGYQSAPSVLDNIALTDWNDEHQVGLLEDNVSLIRFLELRDIPCETLSEKATVALYQKTIRLVSALVPLEEENPWHVSVYVQDDMNLEGVKRRLEDYIKPALKDDPFTRHFLEQVQYDHLDLLCREDGLFTDPMSGLPFRGSSRRIRLALYRRYKTPVKGFNPATDGLAEIQEVTENLLVSLKEHGLSVRVMQGKHVYDWWVRWLNPAPAITDGDVEQLLTLFPYPAENQRPFGWSIAQNAFKSQPESTPDGWRFDGLDHKALVFAELESAPTIGVMSREREAGGKRYTLLDRLPPGAIYTLHMVFEAKEQLHRHLEGIEKSAIGKGNEPARIRQDVKQAMDVIENGNLLIRTTQALLLRGKGQQALATQERMVRTLLGNAGIKVLDSRFTLYPADNYLRFLPGNYDHDFERSEMYVSQYLFASDLAALLPFYGRARGDQLHPLFTFFNRGGEAFIFDPYHNAFKSANSHMVLFGTTGSGKSVMITYMVLQLLAVKGARVVILEAGGSFDVLSQYLKARGKTVTAIKFDRAHPVPVNGFAEAYSILDALNEAPVTSAFVEEKAEEQLQALAQQGEEASATEKAAKEDRDILNEMALIVRCMITGGQEVPEGKDRLDRADQGRITQVIIEVVRHCHQAGKPQVLTEDIVAGFKRAAARETDRETAGRYRFFADAMTEFVTGELAAFFNRPSEPAPDFDYLHIDLGFLKEEGMEAGLSVTVISLLARILGIAEANQFNDQPTVFIMDEAHLSLQFPVISTFATLMAKVSRKLGLWLMPATQNITDLNGPANKKLLSMMENWLCLSLSDNEIKKISEFRTLTPEQEVLLSGVKKYPKLYAEGVLLGANYQGLFRHIPPRLALALAMTEQNEKAERRALCEQYGYSELEAVEHIAQAMKTHRHQLKEDEVFDD